jgi:hypothetical protein
MLSQQKVKPSNTRDEAKLMRIDYQWRLAVKTIACIPAVALCLGFPIAPVNATTGPSTVIGGPILVHPPCCEPMPPVPPVGGHHPTDPRHPGPLPTPINPGGPIDPIRITFGDSSA